MQAHIPTYTKATVELMCAPCSPLALLLLLRRLELLKVAPRLLVDARHAGVEVEGIHLGGVAAATVVVGGGGGRG